MKLNEFLINLRLNNLFLDKIGDIVFFSDPYLPKVLIKYNLINKPFKKYM